MMKIINKNGDEIMENIHTFVVLAYKESEHLEECVKSVLNQSIKTNVIIATATPNEFINNIAEKYNIDVVINQNHKDIGGDFNFAVQVASTDLVTIAHQDDVYDYTYAERVIEKYKQYPESLIIFTDYYEIRNGIKQITNTNLKIKRILLTPIKNNKKGNVKFRKRNIIRIGNSICCPAVTFSKKNINKDVLEKLFICDFKCNVDWYTWELLSNEKGNFTYINEKLMGHRISEESTTTKIISENIRTKEDLIMLQKFWPKMIASLINRVYSKSEKSNNLNK